MAIDLEDEILQDFLVEAGEILELLGEQLVQLEQTPDDPDLLNAIFRGFHTVKGGAGFLAIDSLVVVCHKAEDVFNILRQGDRSVTSDLMDVILQVLDVVNSMFDQVRSGEDPDPAEQQLITRLGKYTVPESEDENNSAPEIEEAEEEVESVAIEEHEKESQEEEMTVSESSSAMEIVEQEFGAMLDQISDDDESASLSSDSEDITEEEFEDLLDSLHGKGGGPTSSKNKGIVEDQNVSEVSQDGDSELISEEEFESLLDELHGSGSGPTSKKTETSSTSTASSDDITEEEFENLLDELHGKGKFGVAPESQNQEPTQTSSASNAAKKANEKSPTSNKEAKSSEKKSEPANTAAEKPKKEPESASKPEQIVEPAPVKAKETMGSKPEKTQAKQPANPPETTVRVDTQVLDDIMNMVGELVLVRNRLQTLRSVSDNDEQMTKAIANLDIVTADLQLAVMKTRMQPIKKVFGRFPRVVRDLARSLNKEIKLELVGEETDLDKNLVEALADPLVHLVRNAVDHGIESPAEREAAGKPREGVVILTASQQGDHIELSIKDDGKGMNANALRAKVVEKGLMDSESAARLDDKECFNLIFMPGFSTKSEISDISGRGVGMDVVKTRITQMNGMVEIDSKEGAGSNIIIKVPLTLAIMPTLMVKLGNQAFALPLANVLEILDLDLRITNIVDGQPVVMVRNKALPLYYLGEWLVKDPNYTVKKHVAAHVVVVNSGGRQIGFVVDQLIGQEEVVIKALGAKLQGVDGLAGATITGDGRIALILDVPGLMKRYAN